MRSVVFVASEIKERKVVAAFWFAARHSRRRNETAVTILTPSSFRPCITSTRVGSLTLGTSDHRPDILRRNWCTFRASFTSGLGRLRFFEDFASGTRFKNNYLLAPGGIYTQPCLLDELSLVRALVHLRMSARDFEQTFQMNFTLNLNDTRRYRGSTSHYSSLLKEMKLALEITN